jgi:hypothetical protein
MTTHSHAALKRMEAAGFVPSMQRRDCCGGCTHSTIRATGCRIWCKELAAEVTGGSKCEKWAASARSERESND